MRTVALDCGLESKVVAESFAEAVYCENHLGVQTVKKADVAPALRV